MLADEVIAGAVASAHAAIPGPGAASCGDAGLRESGASGADAKIEAPYTPPPRNRWPLGVILLCLLIGGATGAWALGLVPETLLRLLAFSGGTPLAGSARTEAPAGNEKGKQASGYFKPTAAQWASLTVEPVAQMPFRTTLVTDGKIAINEDVTTQVFSPYAGRVIKLFAKPGDRVEKGQPLFVVEASDMVQAQNDFLTAKAGVNKARTQLVVAEIVLHRHRELLAGNAVAKRDFEQAEIGHVSATQDLKAAEVALEAARNRLRILGKSDAAIGAFEEGRQSISAETTVPAPISGTVVQRKVGPGQFVAGASNDPVFVIGDLSTVWIVANVRETDASRIKLGQKIEFTILAAPDRVFSAEIAYIPSSVNPETHRIQVRAEVANSDGLLRPEMFANVIIVTADHAAAVAVPRHAVIYEGENARVWSVRADRSIELKTIVPGIVTDGFVQVVSGLDAGETIITRGSLFIDRLAAPGASEQR
jgi:cobalt-zinc-cadmium efflux system membrane fusion protein